jgi:VanZ family protein
MPLPPARTRFLAAALLPILVATLWPFPGQEPEGFTSCIACGEHATSDVLINIILFAPLGAALALHMRSIPRCALSAALLSATIELAQLYIPGRDSSLGDVLSNTLGGTLGAVLTRTVVLWLLPSPERAARLSRTAAFTAGIACWATGVLLTPAFPDALYYGQWTPSLAHLELYRGRVLDATLSGLPITPGPLPDSRLVRQRLASQQGFSLRVRAVAGPRTPGLAALVAIYDDHEREIVLLGPDRDDLVLRFRARATDLRFDQPDVRLVSALQHVAAGDTLDITVTRGGEQEKGRYSFALNGRITSGLGCAVGCGWAVLMYPESLPPWLRTLLGVAWVGGLFAPAGFWMRTRSDALFTAAAVATGLAGAPAFTPLVATPALQWAAALLGMLAGAAVRIVLSRRFRGSSPEMRTAIT